MSIQVKPKVNDKLKYWIDQVKSNRGKLQEYLGMTFYVTERNGKNEYGQLC